MWLKLLFLDDRDSINKTSSGVDINSLKAPENSKKKKFSFADLYKSSEGLQPPKEVLAQMTSFQRKQKVNVNNFGLLLSDTFTLTQQRFVSLTVLGNLKY